MRILLFLVLLFALGCKQEPAAEGQVQPDAGLKPDVVLSQTPDVSAPATPGQELRPQPRSPYQGDTTLVPHQSPIGWPEAEIELNATDSISVSDWIGGEAGTDFSSVTVYGDGRVLIESGRQGGEGGEESRVEGRLSKEETQAVFSALRDSKLLTQDESHRGTTGSTLSVVYQGKEDRVTVVSRRGEAQAILGGAASVAR